MDRPPLSITSKRPDTTTMTQSDGHHDGTATKTIGVLGGMSAESTVEYYTGLNDGINDALGGHHAAEVVIRSVDFGVVERCIRTDAWDEAADYLTAAARELERGGADVVLMATNTMHEVAPAIIDALSIPFVHIVDPTAEAIVDAGIDTIGLLGTQSTMASSRYRDRFEEHGIDVLVPGESDRERLEAVIFDELTRGRVEADSLADAIEMVDRLAERGAGGIVLGCTELELLLSPGDVPEVSLFDTTALHVERGVELALEGVGADGHDD
ncbi:aspartate/glutamate racemase family protein [Natrialbaceae archaeon A-CW3]